MANFGEAAETLRLIRNVVKDEIEKNPTVLHSIRVHKAVIAESRSDRPNPNTAKHTVWVKLSPFDEAEIELQYAPKIPLSDLQPGMAASVWYYMGASNAYVMNDALWSAYGQDDLEALASGDLSIIEALQIIARVLKDERLSGYSLQFLAPKLDPQDENAKIVDYYIPIGTLPATVEESYGAITINGRIGGYGADNINTVNMTIGSGGRLIISGDYTTITGDYIVNDTYNRVIAFEAYQDEAENADEPNKNPINLYLRMYSGMAADLSLTAFGATLSRTSESQSEMPTGNKLTIVNGLHKNQ